MKLKDLSPAAILVGLSACGSPSIAPTELQPLDTIAEEQPATTVVDDLCTQAAIQLLDSILELTDHFNDPIGSHNFTTNGYLAHSVPGPYPETSIVYLCNQNDSGLTGCIVNTFHQGINIENIQLGYMTDPTSQQSTLFVQDVYTGEYVYIIATDSVATLTTHTGDSCTTEQESSLYDAMLSHVGDKMQIAANRNSRFAH